MSVKVATEATVMHAAIVTALMGGEHLKNVLEQLTDGS